MVIGEPLTPKRNTEQLEADEARGAFQITRTTGPASTVTASPRPGAAADSVGVGVAAVDEIVTTPFVAAPRRESPAKARTVVRPPADAKVTVVPPGPVAAAA